MTNGRKLPEISSIAPVLSDFRMHAGGLFPWALGKIGFFDHNSSSLKNCTDGRMAIMTATTYWKDRSGAIRVSEF